jgi:hypothetical protein
MKVLISTMQTNAIIARRKKEHRTVFQQSQHNVRQVCRHCAASHSDYLRLRAPPLVLRIHICIRRDHRIRRCGCRSRVLWIHITNTEEPTVEIERILNMRPNERCGSYTRCRFAVHSSEESTETWVGLLFSLSRRFDRKPLSVWASLFPHLPWIFGAGL